MIDLREYFLVGSHSLLVSSWKDVFVIVTELLSAHRTYQVSWTWFRLEDNWWSFLLWSQLSCLLLQAIHVLFIKALLIHFGELSLLLPLENWGSKGSLHVDVMDVVLSHIDARAQILFKLLLLWKSIWTKVVTLMSICVSIDCPTCSCHVSSHLAWSETWDTEGLHLCLFGLTFPLHHV